MRVKDTIEEEVDSLASNMWGLLDDREEDQGPVVFCNSGFGLSSSGASGGFKSFYSGSTGNGKANNEDVDGSSWKTAGDGFRGRGGRGGSRGGREGFRNAFKSGGNEETRRRGEIDENGTDEGWKGGEGRGRVRGGFRGGFRDGGGDEETGKRGFGRGGFRGQNEEVFSKVSTADKENQEASENTGHKVVYVPPPPPEEESSIFSHYATGINFDKYDDILVDVSGSNPPKAIMTFDEAGLCESLRKNVTKSGYVKPTPVQKHGIPIISAGRDLMACAQTGSGKTAAFLLPILQRLMADGVAASKFSEVQEPEAIIVAPTRELINQIYLEARKFAYGMAADFLKVDYIFLAVGVVGGACSDVEQTIIQVDQYSTRDQLLELLRSTEKETGSDSGLECRHAGSAPACSTLPASPRQCASQEDQRPTSAARSLVSFGASKEEIAIDESMSGKSLLFSASFHFFHCRGSSTAVSSRLSFFFFDFNFGRVSEEMIPSLKEKTLMKWCSQPPYIAIGSSLFGSLEHH
ncbi:probable ATP-dependent RNA helicase DDX4 [Sinocyclocheilus grahami]|uniref:probable ATP-dependent RNA helicase DDX4 n=1 Tax=Sinocyclocheilus grahami TaxID=75366 RepID=UPI0007ACBF5A|nr:PREDICTED: probable ATP-dependent RNA helicase DDX4 [Sinocyclocheilus grahami]